MIRPVAADGRIETGGAFTPISRPRVVDRIAAAASQRIVLIVAPAGYGKSVALREYLASVAEPCVRYDVQAEHGNLLGFVRGLADALTEIAPDARRTLSLAYEKTRSSDTPGADLAMWLHAHIKTFSGLVAVDDLHVAESDREISKFLVSLIDRTKGRVSWIIASRSSLDLPVGSWLAYGQMDLNIDEQDLRFTIEEARNAAKASRVGVRDEELGEILKMTDGWPTALSFALRTSTRSVDLRNITATTREMVYRYLAEQVYRSLRDDEREVLHFVAYLPFIDLNVLRMAGYGKGKALIEALRDRVSFIYADRPGVYRCHDLFRDFLRHEMDLEGDGIVRETRLRAARALESAGHLAPALRLYTESKSEEDMLRLLGAHGFALVDSAHADAVYGAVDALPQHERSGNAAVLGLRAMAEFESGRFDRAESLFTRGIAASSDDNLAADLAIRLSLVLVNQARDIVPLLQPLIEKDLDEEIRCSAMALLAVGYAYTKQQDKAAELLFEVEETASRVESNELRAKIYSRLGSAATLLELPADRVAMYLSRAQVLAQASAQYSVAAKALTNLANVSLFYDEDASKCSWYAQQALNAAAKAGDRLPMQTALLQLINVEARRGNVDRVGALITQFASATTTDAVRMSYIMPVRGIIAAWEGRFDDAYRLLSMGDPGFYTFDRVLRGAMLAVYAIAAGHRDRAMELVSQTLNEIEAGDYPHVFGKRQAEISRSLCACVEIFAGRTTTANRILQRRGTVEGPSVQAMREAATALWRAAKRPALMNDVHEALETLRTNGWGGLSRVLDRAMSVCMQHYGATPDEESPLTKSELHVLEQLALGNSPKAIAQEAGRSVYTIQAHVQNIIKKLGCSGRQEALSIARRRGIIA